MEPLRPGPHQGKVPDVHIHFGICLGIFLEELKHGVEILLKRQAGIARILHPTRCFGGADNAHLIHTELVHQLCSGQHGVHIQPMHIGLHLDKKTVIHTEADGTQGILLRTLAVTEPVVVADAVKGNFHQRIAADRLHFIKDFLREKITVGIQLLHIHAVRIDGADDLHKVRMEHRLTARNGKGVDTALFRLTDQPFGLLHGKFALQAAVVGGVEAMQAVIVALAGNHPVQRRKIAVIADLFPLPVGKRFLFHGRTAEAALDQTLQKRRVFDLGHSVAALQQSVFFFFQAFCVSLTFYVVGIRHKPPRAQGDVVGKDVFHGTIIGYLCD